MKRLILVCAIVILTCAGSNAFGNTVLTFDDVITGPAGPIPNGYGGLNWSYNFHVLDIASYAGPDLLTGYINGLVSGSYVAVNSDANPAIVSDSYIDFTGAYLTSAWRTGLNIDVEGYRGSTLVYNQTVVVDYYGPTWFEFNFINIDKVRFNSYGGTNAPGLSGSGAHFAMDNFTFIPEPATFLLLTLGGLFLRKRK